MGLEMKPVGEPYAGNPHVRFDDQFVIPLTAAVAAASEGVESLRIISCGQVG